jgi:hypothetical protein
MTWIFIFQKRGGKNYTCKTHIFVKVFKQDDAKDEFLEDATQKKNDQIIIKDANLTQSWTMPTALNIVCFQEHSWKK